MKRLRSALLLDDDYDVNLLNTIIIKRSQLVDSIIPMQSACECIKFLRNITSCGTWPDLILVDINMPKVNGWEFIKALSEEFPRQCSMGVICILSSSLDPRDERKAAESKIIDKYFSKPLSKEKLEVLCELYHEIYAEKSLGSKF